MMPSKLLVLSLLIISAAFVEENSKRLKNSQKKLESWDVGKISDLLDITGNQCFNKCSTHEQECETCIQDNISGTKLGKDFKIKVHIIYG